MPNVSYDFVIMSEIRSTLIYCADHPVFLFSLLPGNGFKKSTHFCVLKSGREDSNLRYPAPKAGAIATRQRPATVLKYKIMNHLGQDVRGIYNTLLKEKKKAKMLAKIDKIT